MEGWIIELMPAQQSTAWRHANLTVRFHVDLEPTSSPYWFPVSMALNPPPKRHRNIECYNSDDADKTDTVRNPTTWWFSNSDIYPWRMNKPIPYLTSNASWFAEKAIVTALRNLTHICLYELDRENWTFSDFSSADTMLSFPPFKLLAASFTSVWLQSWLLSASSYSWTDYLQGECKHWRITLG